MYGICLQLLPLSYFSSIEHKRIHLFKHPISFLKTIINPLLQWAFFAPQNQIFKILFEASEYLSTFSQTENLLEEQSNFLHSTSSFCQIISEYLDFCSVHSKMTNVLDESTINKLFSLSIQSESKRVFQHFTLPFILLFSSIKENEAIGQQFVQKILSSPTSNITTGIHYYSLNLLICTM